jgi:hypothetical protein
LFASWTQRSSCWLRSAAVLTNFAVWVAWEGQSVKIQLAGESLLESSERADEIMLQEKGMPQTRKERYSRKRMTENRSNDVLYSYCLILATLSLPAGFSCEDMSRVNMLSHKSQSSMTPVPIEKSDFDAEALTAHPSHWTSTPSCPDSSFRDVAGESRPPNGLAGPAATRWWSDTDIACRQAVTVKDSDLVERVPEFELGLNTHQTLTCPPIPPARQQRCIG